MRKVSKDGVITIEEAKGTDTTSGGVEGMQFDQMCIRDSYSFWLSVYAPVIFAITSLSKSLSPKYLCLICK